MGKKIQDSSSCPEGWCEGPTEKECEGTFWSDDNVSIHCYRFGLQR